MQNPAETYQRYQRQTILPEFGEAGQHKLSTARVLVVGAGGLGCPVLQYLAAAGVGSIGVVDDDTVQLHNLHRQVLYSMEDIGKPKAVIAGQKLLALNPEIEVKVFQERLTTHNCLDILQTFDIVVDGTDNFATRYLINDACVLLGKPFVFGAISRFEGQVSVFNLPTGENKDIIHYRDLFPNPPQPGEVPNCAEAGVLGVLPAIIGSFMANEVIKLLAGLGKSLNGILLTYNALTNESFQWQLQKHPESDKLVPDSREAFVVKDYAWECGLPATDLEIDIAKMEYLLQTGNVVLVDVREYYEKPVLPGYNHLRIPLAILKKEGVSSDPDQVIFICQTGKRSLAAANWAKRKYGEKKFYSLKRGIEGMVGG